MRYIQFNLNNIIITFTLLSSLVYSYTHTQVHMGTFITLNTHNSKAIEEGFRIFKDLDNRLSTYRPTSEVYKYNLDNNTKLSYETKKLIEISNGLSQATKNYFSIYHKDNNTLDFGAIAKGYAVDKVAKLWKKYDIESGSIAASGDIKCINVCIGGIEHPDIQNQNIVNFVSKRKNLAMSTSGNANNPGHLKNPYTQQSVNNFKSLTLFSYKSNTTLDALATAISVMPKQKAINFLQSLKDIGWIIIDHNTNIIRSKNIKIFIKEIIQ